MNQETFLLTLFFNNFEWQISAVPIWSEIGNNLCFTSHKLFKEYNSIFLSVPYFQRRILWNSIFLFAQGLLQMNAWFDIAADAVFYFLSKKARFCR